MANISARERRRLKLRQSQNESSSSTPSDGRPPLILRRLDRKPNLDAQHKSEIFYNSENSKGSDNNRGVSKSYNEDHIKQQHGLKDSLKIFRQNNPPGARGHTEHDSEANPGAGPRNNFRGNVPTENAAPKPKPIFNRVQSSSSSSVDSSGDDDQGNQLIRLQKQKEK